jgi:hypothetical protein
MAMTKEKREKLSTEAVMDKVIEESAELIQAVCKLKNFGPRPLFEGVQYDNVRDVVTEYKQLRGFMDVLAKRITPRRVSRRGAKSG